MARPRAADCDGHRAQILAAASGVSKATLYHYVKDKPGLLEHIARFVHAYAHAQHQHRVLTEDVKFLDDDARRAAEGGERRGQIVADLLLGGLPAVRSRARDSVDRWPAAQSKAKNPGDKPWTSPR